MARMLKEPAERMNIMMSPNVRKRIQQYAIDSGLSEAASISALCIQALNNMDGIKGITDLASAVKRQQELDSKNLME